MNWESRETYMDNTVYCIYFIYDHEIYNKSS